MPVDEILRRPEHHARAGLEVSHLDLVAHLRAEIHTPQTSLAILDDVDVLSPTHLEDGRRRLLEDRVALDAATSRSRKAALALISGSIRSRAARTGSSRERRRLRAIHGRYHPVDFTPSKRSPGKRVQLDFHWLPHADAQIRGLRHIGFHLDESMSAMVTTAPFVSTACENGVIVSPTLACRVRTMPSKGARINGLTDVNFGQRGDWPRHGDGGYEPGKRCSRLDEASLSCFRA